MIIRRKKPVPVEPELTIEEPVIEMPILEMPEPEAPPVQVFDVDNFDFLQRDERRRGDRRRGYRRIDDRNLVSRAQAEAIAIKEDAVKDGYNRGIEQATEEMALLREALQEFYSYKDKVVEILAKDVLEVALDIAQTIIKKEVEQDKEVLINIISEIMKANVKTEERVTLKVAPDDVEFVKMSLPQILSLSQVSAKISVVPFDNVDRGSVVVETSSGVVDASFRTQLSVLREAFKGIL